MEMDLGSIWMWLLCCGSLGATSVANLKWSPFTEVACFEETKAVAPGTVGWYGWEPGCSARTVSSGAQVVQLHDPFDLVQMATSKLAFNA